MLRATGAALLVASAQAAPDYDAMWSEFKKTYEKEYNDLEPVRFATFKKNVDYIYETNSKSLSFTLGVTEFADMTNEEFKATYMGYNKPANTWAELPHLGTHTYSGEELAEAVDWVAKGAVTQVKNQGHCGSCWSFSTTGALEGAWQVATGKLVPLSEQEFVDCDHVDMGCRGGLMDNAFRFAEQNALCTETSYPYKASKGTCQKSSCTVGIPKGGVTGYMDVPSDSMEAMMSALSKHPVSIAIEADKMAFQMYRGGVLSGYCGTQLDHGVLLVGYGTDGGKDYWKVKNSWGPRWGESGYIRLLKGKGGAGECGLLKQASYPVVKSQDEPSENDWKCDLCKTVATAAEGKTVEACDALCKKTGGFDSTCEKLCDLIQAKLSPEQICQAIHLCPKDANGIPPSIVREIEKLVCEAVKDEIPEDKFASTTCEHLKKVIHILPEQTCEDVVKKIWDDTIASCPKDIVV